MKRIVIAIFFACVFCWPCYAIKSMMFNSVDQYVERSSGIWIVEVVKQSGQERESGPTYEVKVIQTLKGDPKKKTLTVLAISRELVCGRRYLVFGFNRASDSRSWMDNGNVSPIPVPASLSLTELKGKSTKEQISSIMVARSNELDSLIKQLTEEKKALENGLDFQKRLDKFPSKGE
ncbi:MAG: hypothetical protein NTX52_00715 [Planctomycetota bacterium]|nr:hypothetical protein [Planctomycetota bacterium]